MNSRTNLLKKFISMLLLAVSAILFLDVRLGFSDELRQLPVSITLLLLANIILTSLDFRQNIVYLILQLTFFLFLMGGPLLLVLDGEHYYPGKSEQTILTSMTCYWIAAFTIWLYQFLFAPKVKAVSDVQPDAKQDVQTFKIRVISKYGFYIAAAANALISLDTIVYRQTHSLQSYYAEYTPSLPTLVQKMSDCYLIAFMLFLATKPGKREFVLPGAVFVVISLLTLLYGVRNIALLNLLFLLVYFVLRNTEEEKWLTKWHIGLVAVCAPVAIILLQAFDTFRRDTAFSFSQMEELLSFSLIREFFVDQSISSEILPNAIKYSFLLGGQPVPYTFGTLYAYLRQNMIVRFFTGEAAFAANSVEAALNGASLGSRLAYHLYRQSYLAGTGMGGSYIAELYTDFSYIGVFAGTLLLCWFISKFTKSFFSKSPYVCALGLLAIRWVTYIPRDSFFTWAMLSLSIMNLVFLLLVVLLSKLDFGRLMIDRDAGA